LQIFEWQFNSAFSLGGIVQLVEQVLCKHQVVGSSPIASMYKMKYLIFKDKRRRILFSFFERRKLFLKTLIKDMRLPESFRIYAYKQLIDLPRDASITRIRNRCILTNRPRGIYKKFGLSRLMFRKYV